MRIAQLSDPHLLSTRGALHKGVDTWSHFEKALSRLQDHEKLNGLVLTGDIAQDENLATYELLHEVLSAQSLPYWVIPGNHDNPAHMREVFAETMAEDSGGVCFAQEMTDAWVIGLDTHKPGSDSGAITRDTQQWLEDTIRSVGDKPILILMHHPPAYTGDAFFDGIGLADRTEWQAYFRRESQVLGVGFGHLHRALRVSGDPLIQGAPSTAYGVRTVDGKVSVSTEEAGFLIWDLNGTTIDARVCSLG